MFGFIKPKGDITRYRIRKIGDKFYPEFYDLSWAKWLVIHNEGRETVFYSTAVSADYECNTEEEAGKLINYHSILFSEGSVIWEG